MLGPRPRSNTPRPPLKKKKKRKPRTLGFNSAGLVCAHLGKGLGSSRPHSWAVAWGRPGVRKKDQPGDPRPLLVAWGHLTNFFLLGRISLLEQPLLLHSLTTCR